MKHVFGMVALVVFVTVVDAVLLMIIVDLEGYFYRELFPFFLTTFYNSLFYVGGVIPFPSFTCSCFPTFGIMDTTTDL